MTQSTDTTSMHEKIEEAVERLDSLIAEEIKRASDSEQQLMGKPISMGTGRELHLRLEKLFKKELRTITSKSAENERERIVKLGHIFINSKYPPNSFSSSETGETYRGVREPTHIRMMTNEDERVVSELERLLEALSTPKQHTTEGVSHE